MSATAIAKLWMLLTDSFADIRVGIPREILWLSVGFEFWLAYENFRVRDLRVLAFVNTFVFGSFAIFATIRWLQGYSSCGCSGKLEFPVWLFILIDLGIVAWFSSSATHRSRLTNGRHELLRWWCSWSPEKRGRYVGCFFCIALIIGLQLPVTKTLRAMVWGEPPVVAKVSIDELDGVLVVDQKSTGQVELWNRSLHPAEIVGVSRSCRCFDLTEDPISMFVPAQGRLVLPLILKPNRPGPLHQRVELFLDHPKQFRVNVDVLGSVEGVQ